MNKNEKGFSIIEALLILVVIGAVSGTGWFVWNQRKTKPSEVSSSKTQTEQAKSETPETPAEQEDQTCTTVTEKGWTTKTDQASGVSYAVDSSWPDETKVTVYKVDEDIPMGYGAPVSVRFNSASMLWEEYESGTKRTNYNTEDTTIKVLGNLPTALLNTGDGPASELRILFVKDSKAIQIALPPVQYCSPNPYSVYVEYVIKSISIK